MIARNRILILLVVIGCAVSAPPGPPAYQDGFRDGCSSGYAAAGTLAYQWTKDVERAMEDKLYATGWADAYDRCKTEWQTLPGLRRR